MDFKAYVRAHLPPLVIDREPEIVDELAQHLADLYREARASGLEHAAALARATEALPRHSDDFARALETSSRTLPALIADRWKAADDGLPVNHGRRGWSVLSDLRRDIRYAIRMLARTPGFTFVIVLTLALGIGANAVIFSAVDAVLLRSAPVADEARVVSLYTAASSGRDPFSSSSYPDYVDLRASGAFADLATYSSIDLVLDQGGSNEPLTGELVSSNYFDVIGIRPSLGRGFIADEDRAGSPVRVAVISDGMWRNRLGARGDVVGSTISLNGQPFTVVGVTPRGFTGPVLGRLPEVWAPMALQPELRPPSAGVRRSLGGPNLLTVRGLRWLNVIGRLREDGSLEQARAAAEGLAVSLERQHAASNRGRRFTVVPLGEGPGLRASVGPLLRMLTAAVTIVLLIACANVAGLLMVRSIARRREVAVRMAVGAGRWRLVRQLLTESLLLALLGSVGGLLIAWWGTPLLTLIGLPESVPVAVTARVWLYACGLAVASGLLFGLAPALQAFRANTLVALREQSAAVAGGAAVARIRSGFVILQVALSLILLVGAGLFLRTLKNATSVQLGYDVERVLLGDINLDVRGYSEAAGQEAYRQILEKVGAVPGVVAASAARVTVLSGAARTLNVSRDGLPVALDNSNALNVRANVITEKYLEAIGTPLLRGRNFQPADTAGAPRVTIVSQSLATRLFGDADPIGRTAMLVSTPLQIVGVVPDTIYRSTTEQNPPPFLYMPLSQNYESGMTLHVKVSGDPAQYAGSIGRALRDVDRQLVLGRPRALATEFENSVADQRLMATLVGLFGLIAVVLAGVGLYGVMAQMAGQRTSEIGIRLALGAMPSSILRLLLADGLRLVAIGAVLGLAGAFASVRYVRAQLFGVEPTDPVTFAAVCGVLVITGLVACVVPARRAMRISPSLTLKAG